MRVLISAIVVLVAVAFAAPARADKRSEKQAKELYFAGNKRLKRGDYVGAVDLYEAAYAKFPNPNILVNMGTALRALGRNVDAVRAYERYLEAKPAGKQATAVRKLLVELNGRIARIQIEVEERGARVLLDGKEIGKSPQKLSVRVEPGPHMIAAEKAGFTPSLATITVRAGEERSVQLKLIKEAEEPEAETDEPSETRTDEPLRVRRSLRDARDRSHAGKLGGMLRADIDGNSIGRGAVVTAGGTYGIGKRLELSAAGIIGSAPGLYLGTRVFLSAGTWKPNLGLGAPIQFTDGETLVGVHASAGLQWDPTARLGLLVSLGVEHFMSTPDNFESTVFVPSVGMHVRL